MLQLKNVTVVDNDKWIIKANKQNSVNLCIHINPSCLFFSTDVKWQI
jgi:hypothetical protein